MTLKYELFGNGENLICINWEVRYTPSSLSPPGRSAIEQTIHGPFTDGLINLKGTNRICGLSGLQCVHMQAHQGGRGLSFLRLGLLHGVRKKEKRMNYWFWRNLVFLHWFCNFSKILKKNRKNNQKNFFALYMDQFRGKYLNGGLVGISRKFDDLFPTIKSGFTTPPYTLY